MWTHLPSKPSNRRHAESWRGQCWLTLGRCPCCARDGPVEGHLGGQRGTGRAWAGFPRGGPASSTLSCRLPVLPCCPTARQSAPEPQGHSRTGPQARSRAAAALDPATPIASGTMPWRGHSPWSDAALRAGEARGTFWKQRRGHSMAGAARPTSSPQQTAQRNLGCPGRAGGGGSTSRVMSRAAAHKIRTNLQTSPGSAVS